MSFSISEPRTRASTSLRCRSAMAISQSLAVRMRTRKRRYIIPNSESAYRLPCIRARICPNRLARISARLVVPIGLHQRTTCRADRLLSGHDFSYQLARTRARLVVPISLHQRTACCTDWLASGHGLSYRLAWHQARLLISIGLYKGTTSPRLVCIRARLQSCRRSRNIGRGFSRCSVFFE